MTRQRIRLTLFFWIYLLISGTATAQIEMFPAWSPDGTKIAYVSGDDEDSLNVYVMNADGTNPTSLTHHNYAAWLPVWSPDSRKIAFWAIDSDNDLTYVYVINADGTHLRKLLTQNITTDDLLLTSPFAWSPDGRKIACIIELNNNVDIYVISADGHTRNRLTSFDTIDVSPVWSPDGTKIAFWSIKDESSDIYVMNADGSDPTRLTQNRDFNAFPAWSPDGTKIAFWSNRNNSSDIYVMNADGSDPTRLTYHDVWDDLWAPPAWSPDGTKIAFHSDFGGGPHIHVVGADGGNPENLTCRNPLDESYFPMWSPDGTKIAYVIFLNEDNSVIDVTPVNVKLDSVLPPTQLREDVNKDGIVNIVDLTFVASHFGKNEQTDADINGDGAVNIIDLALVAAAFGNGVGAAPVLWSLNPDNMLTHPTVEKWLQEARQMNLTDSAFQHGFQVLEQLLTALTPKETALLSNYPNPFNPETWIPYQLAKSSDVKIRIYDTRGIVVRHLDLGHQPAGTYIGRRGAAYWDGRNAVGEPVASGTYFYTLIAGDFSATRKMLIRK